MNPPASSQPIACSLDATGLQHRLEEWSSLASDCHRTEATPAGATLWFEPAAEATLRALAAKEAACCGFLRVDVHPEGGTVRLDITSDQPEARPVIEMLTQQVTGSQETG